MRISTMLLCWKWFQACVVRWGYTFTHFGLFQHFINVYEQVKPALVRAQSRDETQSSSIAKSMDALDQLLIKDLQSPEDPFARAYIPVFFPTVVTIPRQAFHECFLDGFVLMESIRFVNDICILKQYWGGARNQCMAGFVDGCTYCDIFSSSAIVHWLAERHSPTNDKRNIHVP